MTAPAAFLPGLTQKVAYTGTHGAIANPITPGVQMVRVVCSSAAYLAFGTAPVATNAGIWIAAGIPEVFQVRGGKVSAIQDTAGGNLFVTEMS